jgi:hypothetical protein
MDIGLLERRVTSRGPPSYAATAVWWGRARRWALTPATAGEEQRLDGLEPGALRAGGFQRKAWPECQDQRGGSVSGTDAADVAATARIGRTAAADLAHATDSRRDRVAEFGVSGRQGCG